MSVLQYAKRSVTLLAAVSMVLTGCGDSSPDVPFNPAGTSADMEAVGAAFGSSAFVSFSSLSYLFDAVYTGAPLVSSSVAALDLRARGAGGMRAGAIRSAKQLARILSAGRNTTLSASRSAIPAGIAGKTYEYSGGAYVPTDRTGAPSNGVRFLLYAVDPVTLQPVLPLVETGYVDITDLSGTTTESARLQVVSGTTTYVDYTVVANSVAGRISVIGFVTDGSQQANLNVVATISGTGAVTLVYGLDVPQRDVSIDLRLAASGSDIQNGVFDIILSMNGPNGTVSLSGQFTATGATLTVRTGGATFATITVTGSADPVITGANGQPITDQDAAALQAIFELTADAFGAFGQLVAPVSFFLQPAA
ncbi:MAG: hypothetical protein ABI703_09640 [Gemmatimonadales bacterium]